MGMAVPQIIIACIKLSFNRPAIQR